MSNISALNALKIQLKNLVLFPFKITDIRMKILNYQKFTINQVSLKVFLGLGKNPNHQGSILFI